MAHITTCPNVLSYNNSHDQCPVDDHIIIRSMHERNFIYIFVILIPYIDNQLLLIPEVSYHSFLLLELYI